MPSVLGASLVACLLTAAADWERLGSSPPETGVPLGAGGGAASRLADGGCGEDVSGVAAGSPEGGRGLRSAAGEREADFDDWWLPGDALLVTARAAMATQKRRKQVKTGDGFSVTCLEN